MEIVIEEDETGSVKDNIKRIDIDSKAIRIYWKNGEVTDYGVI